MEAPSPEDAANFNFTSRKLWMSVGCIVAILLAAFLCGVFPGMVPVYPEFVTGVVAIYGLYATANVGTKYVYNKFLSVSPVAPEPSDPNLPAPSVPPQDTP